MGSGCSSMRQVGYDWDARKDGRQWGATGQWDEVVEARVLGHEAGGLERIGCSGLDVRSATGGVEGKAESTRVTGNHVKTVHSLDRGREGLTTDKGNIDLIK